MLNNSSNSDFSPSEAVLKKVNSMLKTGDVEYLDSQTFVDVMDFFNNQFKYQESIKLGVFGLKIHRNSALIHLKKAQTYSNLNNIELAKEHLKIAEGFEKNNGDVYLTKAHLLSKEGHTLRAIETYRLAIKHLEFPEDAYPFLAFELKAINRHQEAISILKKYLLDYPDDEMCSSMLFAILEEHEYYVLGAKFFKKLVNKSVFNHLNWFYLGVFYKALNKYDEALLAYDYCYLIEPKFVASYHELANIFIEREQYKKAIYFLEEVVEIEEPYAMTFTKLAELFRFSNQFDKSLAYAHKAVKEDPQLDSAWFELGRVLNELEDFVGSITAFKNAKSLNDDEFDYHLHYANTYVQLQEWETAKELLIGIINKFGMHNSLLKNVLICSIHTQDYEDALTYSEKAIEFFKDVDFLYFSAYFSYKTNNKNKTLSYMIQAINENSTRMSTLETLMKEMFEEPYIKSLVSN